MGTSASELTQAQATGMAVYDAAVRALAEAVAVDEILTIKNIAVAMKAAAAAAGNREAERDAMRLRVRATLALGRLMQQQAETIGLNVGAAGGGEKTSARGSIVNPRDTRPTYASQGISKRLAHQARVLARMSDAKFEEMLTRATATVGRVHGRVIHEVELEQRKQERRARTAQGGTVGDLYKLIRSGFLASTILIDPPWPFATFSDRAMRHVTQHYDTMTLEEIRALPIAQLAAQDCALFMCATWPHMPIWNSTIEAWGFKYSGCAFVWEKTNANGGDHMGQGYGTRANTEVCLLGTRGSPLRLDAGVPQIIRAPVREHSRKPDEMHLRIERLFGGPRLELFARELRSGWMCWGNELPPPLAPNNTMLDALDEATS
jgi:N6-adenosine-specific RNA methylase IME4